MKKIGITVLVSSLFLPSIGLAQKASTKENRNYVENQIFSLNAKNKQDKKKLEQAKHYVDSLTRVIAQTEEQLQQYEASRRQYDQQAAAGCGCECRQYAQAQKQAEQQKIDNSVLTKIKEYHKKHDHFWDVKLPQRIVGVYVYGAEYYVLSWDVGYNLRSLYRYNCKGIFQNMVHGKTAEGIISQSRQVVDYSILESK